MRYLKSVILPLIILLVASCSLLDNDTDSKYIKIDYSKLKQDSTRLVGTWKWVQSKSYSQIDGEPHFTTPDSSGITKKIIITDIDHIQYFKNGELEFKGSLDDFSSVYWGVSKYWLVLSNIAADGVESIYLRVE